jgi:hypothetical protein
VSYYVADESKADAESQRGVGGSLQKKIDPTMKELKPKTDKWKDWLAFEGVYDEALHLIRLHVPKALKGKEKGLYGFTEINPKIQKPRTKQSEEHFAKQDIQRRLMRMKSKLEKLIKYHKDIPAPRLLHFVANGCLLPADLGLIFRKNTQKKINFSSRRFLISLKR